MLRLAFRRAFSTQQQQQSQLRPLLSVNPPPVLFIGADSSFFTSKWKIQLGTKALFVTGDDAQSKEASQRMWFEMQNIGVQMFSYTIDLPLPSAKVIEAGVDMYRRMGATSVAVLGSGAVIDAAKGIRHLIETGSKTVSSLDADAVAVAAGAGAKKSTIRQVPLIVIPTSLSPVPSSSSWQYMHHDEDVLVRRLYRAPEVSTEKNIYARLPLFFKQNINNHILKICFVMYVCRCSCLIRHWCVSLPRSSSRPPHLIY